MDKYCFLVYYWPYVVYFACSDAQGELTYGKIGEWRFDKRAYDHVQPPRNLPLPPPGVSESVVSAIIPFVPIYCCGSLSLCVSPATPHHLFFFLPFLLCEVFSISSKFLFSALTSIDEQTRCR